MRAARVEEGSIGDSCSCRNHSKASGDVDEYEIGICSGKGSEGKNLRLHYFLLWCGLCITS